MKEVSKQTPYSWILADKLNTATFINSMAEKFDSLVDEVFKGVGISRIADVNYADFIPASSTTLSDLEWVLQMEIPGVTKENVAISLIHQKYIVIEGKKEYSSPVSQDAKNCEILSSEFVFGSFRRQIELPSKLDTTKIQASFENGVLKVSIPKLAEEKQEEVITKITIS